MPNSEYLFENETMVVLSYFFIFIHIGSKINIGKKKTKNNIYFVNYFQIYWSLIIRQWSKFIILNSTDKKNEAQRSQ